MLERFSLPQGVKNFSPDRAEEIKRVEDTLLGEFSRWGYRPVITPLFESLESILTGLGEDLREKTLKFVDPATGEVVALRPDITPQVARMVAVDLKEHPKPLRLCYSGRVVRYEEKGSGKEREVFQVGCELFGLEGPEADAEIIALASKSVEKLGIENLVLDIGHTGFLRHLLEKTGKCRGRIEEALKKKDTEALKLATLSAALPVKIREAVCALPELFGGREVLEAAKRVPIFKRYAKEIENVLSIVDEFNLNFSVNIDFGELRGFNYYTGVTFELISPNASSPLLRGGRYDMLLVNYGYDAPATGFAVDVESVLGVINSSSENHYVHFVIIPKKRSLRHEAIRLAEWLRSSGFKVVLDIKADPKLIERRLSDNYLSNSYGVIFIETPTRLKLVESRSGSSKEFSNLEELLKGGI
ncbi:MAG: ATP phosphoribosyltransferase regulatory subunit [Thermodesulfobacteriota bacterium]